MPNNNVAILSIMSKFDEKSARQAAERANKVYDEALSDIGNVNFDKKLIENFDKAMNLLKNKFKKVNLSSYTNNLLDSIFSDKDIKEKSKDIELFISKIEMLKKASSGQDINAFNTFSAKQIDALISRTEKLAQKQEEINEKTREYNREATKIAKTNRNISTIDKNYGNQDYSKTLESLKKSLGTEKEFTAEQNQSIENLAKMVNLYQVMEKSEPQKGTAEAIRYSKDLLAVTQKIKEERDKIDAFSQNGASAYIANNGLYSVNKVSDYTVNKSKDDFVKASLSNLKTQEAKLQSDLTTYISESVQKNLAKVSKEADAVIDKAEKRVENLQNKIESLQTTPAKDGSSDSVIGNIVSNSDIKTLEEIEDRLYAISDLDADGEATKQQLKEYIQLYKQYEQLITSDSTVKFDPGLKEEYDSIVESDNKLKKYADTLDETISKQKELNAVKSNENEVSVDTQTEQLVKQEEQIKETIQAEKQLQDAQEKISSNTKISVDVEQAIADINKIKESLNSIPEEKNIKITISDSDYTNTPLLSDAEGNTITAFRGVVGAWSGLINQDGIGFFTDKLKLAADYADSLAESGKVYQANLSFKNPLEVEGNGAKWDEIDFNGVKKTTDEIVELAKQLGHDGVIFKNIRDGFTDTDEDISNVMVALNAAQVKNEQVIGTVKAGTGEMVDVANRIDNATDTATNSTVESQNKIQEELKETQKQAEQTSESLSKVNSSNVSFTQENSELDTKISNIEKLNNSVKELISNSGDYKVGEIVGWDDTEKLLSIVQELDNYDVLKSLGLSDGAIQEEEGKIKGFVQTIKYQYDEFVNAWNKQDDDAILDWSDSIGSNLNELNLYINSLISSYRQLSDVSSANVDKSNISSENLSSGNVDKVTNSLVEEQKAVGELDMVFRGLEGSLNGFMSNSGRLATFFTTSPLLARQYADSLGGVYQAMVALGKSLDINAEGRDWNVVEYLGDGSDEASRKIIELRKQIDNLYEQLNASGASGTGLDGLVEESRGDFSRMVQLYGDAGIEYNSYIEAVEKGNVIENQENQTVKQLMIQLYELEKAYRVISDAKDNVYGTHTTDEFAELAKANGYDSVMFRNIKDSFDRTKNLTDVGVIFDESQIASVKNVSNIIDDLVQKIDGVKTQHGLNLPINIELPKEISRLSDGNFVNNLTGEIYDDVQKAIDSLKELDAQIESTSPIKDVFQASTEKSGMDEVATATEEAVQAKKDFASANENVQSSINDSKSPLQLEAELMDQIAKSARDAVEAKKEFVKANEQVKNSTDDSNDSASKGKSTNRNKISETDYSNKSEHFSSIANKTLSNNGYTILGGSVSTELIDGLVKVNAKIKTVEGTWKSFSAKIDADGNLFDQKFKTVTKGVNKLEDALNGVKDSQNDSSAILEKYTEKLSDYTIKAKTLGQRNTQTAEYSSAVEKYKQSIESLSEKINYFNQNGGIKTDDDVRELKELQKAIENTYKEINSMSTPEKGSSLSGINTLFSQLYKLRNTYQGMTKEQRNMVNSLEAEWKQLGKSLNLEQAKAQLRGLQAELERTETSTKTLWGVLKDKAFYNFAHQIGTMFSFYDLINVGREGIDTLKEFDDGLTKISYTMDMTKSQLDDLGNSVLDMASDMKSSIDDAMQVAQIYANMQTSAEEIQRLSEPTLILSNLYGFDSSTIADDIQAVTQQFDILAEDSMHIADVYDYISRNIAVDYSKGLNAMAEGLQVAGSTAKQAGLSYEQTASIIAKAVEKTRLEGSQVGNGLKTIMTRLSKVGELSEEVDNETLSQASESLKKVGIEVYNLDGSYREFDVIMGELANKWDDLTDAEKSNISFAIAATRQTNLLSAVLSNFSDSMQLAEEATNANGSALENQQKYMESFSGHLQSLETEAKIAWLNILDSETLKDGVDLLTGLVKVVGQLVDTFGLLGTAAGIGGIFAGFKNIGRPKMFGLYKYADINMCSLGY